jgi:hypothetical protein
MTIVVNSQNLIGKTFDRLPGGNRPENRLTLLGGVQSSVAVNETDWNQGLGVHAEWPGSTPKYHTGADRIAATGKMAKIFLQISPAMESIISDEFGPSAVTVLKKCGYVDWLMTNAVEEFEEKMQVVTLSGDNYVAYYFGQKPPVFQYTGVVLNTWQDDWRIQLLRLYDKLFRGSKLAQLRSYIKIFYDTVIVVGSIPNLRMELNSNVETGAHFAFSFLVKEYVVLQKPVNPPFLLPEDACYPALADTQTVGAPTVSTKGTLAVNQPVKHKQPKTKTQDTKERARDKYALTNGSKEYRPDDTKTIKTNPTSTDLADGIVEIDI